MLSIQTLTETDTAMYSHYVGSGRFYIAEMCVCSLGRGHFSVTYHYGSPLSEGFGNLNVAFSLTRHRKNIAYLHFTHSVLHIMEPGLNFPFC